jgi:ankyrin repeat protein
MILEVARELSGVGWMRSGHPTDAHLWMAARSGDLHKLSDVIHEVIDSQDKLNEIVNYVWGCGADKNGRRRHRVRGIVCTPLFIASLMGHTRVVSVLLAFEANLHEKGTTGYTPLHIAAFMGHTDVVRRLILRGADVNSLGNTASTPLHEAARSGQHALVLFLIEQGANVCAEDKYGHTPVHYAVKNHHFATVDVLLANGAFIHPRSDKVHE